jgi:hypothetical protein
MVFLGNYNFLEFIANSKSGQFFFYSHDGKYMIKTQTKEENKFMRKILPHYFKYVTENPHTFLCKIVDMHRVKMYHINRKVHFVIMASVFDTPEKIHTIYDLKGSLIGRKVKDKEREANPGAVLKDINFLEDQVKIKLGPKKDAFIHQLKQDAEFLADLNIMDYSLLLGIHYRNLRSPTDFDEVHHPDPSRDSSIAVRSNTPFRQTISFSPKAPFLQQISARTVGNSDDNDSKNEGAGLDATGEQVGHGIALAHTSSHRASKINAESHVSPPLTEDMMRPAPIDTTLPVPHDADSVDPSRPPKPPSSTSPKRHSRRPHPNRTVSMNKKVSKLVYKIIRRLTANCLCFRPSHCSLQRKKVPIVES